MNIIELIKTRRSIRKYSNQDVSEEQLEKLLTAAMYAPSARNQQPWHFVVVDQPEILEAITRIHPYSQMLKEASKAIVVCADKALEVSEGYWVQDCAAATQNILLAAHGLGLGAVWLGVYPREVRVTQIKALFNMPESAVPLSIISIGYPAEEKKIIGRFQAKRIHKNTW